MTTINGSGMCFSHSFMLLIFVEKGVWQHHLAYQSVLIQYVKEAMLSVVLMFNVQY
jgi:hypothetical protein